MSAPAWMKRLAAPGRVLAPLPAGRSGYGVFVGSDRRRRPLALAPAPAVKAALSDGVLDQSEDGLRLTEAGRARLRRDEAGGAEPFADQHRRVGQRALVEPNGSMRSVRANLDASAPLRRYTRPHAGRPALLGPVHVSAAEVLRGDYERSALRSRVTQDWSGLPGAKTRSAPRDRADAPASRLDAQARVLDALEAVGPGFDRLLVSVLIRECGMEAAERDLNWPARSGAPALRMALDRLAFHYRLTPKPRPADPFA